MKQGPGRPALSSAKMAPRPTRPAGASAETGLLEYMPDSMQIPELKVLDSTKPTLPVLAHRQEVLKSVRENRVTVLSGETGSGKTTQVPQFIIDDLDLVPEGMSVIVTQPRRIACINIAERVAQERGETVGQTVGYQIRFVNNTSPTTKLIFCTTAVLLRRLHSDPNFDQVAVLCVDEVHERDAYTEFLLLAVRERLLRGEMTMKLVLMSATLSVDSFIDFFADLRSSSIPPDPDPRSYVKIEGRMFPVKESFLEDALEWTGHELPNASGVQRPSLEKVAARLQETRGRQYSEKTLRSLAVAGEKEVHQELIRQLVLLFHKTAEKFGDKGRGGILVFLPGWADISGMQQRLIGDRGLLPLPLHSNLSPEDQQRIFEDPPAGRRKVVLSTNIAETSVTVDDIVFVINSGVMKERVFDADRQLGALETTLNTWANATQRAGRAGRTREGVVVHLFPQWKFPELRRWPTPEILSKSLEEVVLQLLALGLGDPHDVLARSLSQPSVACVEHAVWLLQEMSMMSQRERMQPSEALLPLGRWLAPIPLHPMSAKALLFGALFGVLLPVAAMVAFLNIKNPFVQPANGQVLRGGKQTLVRDKHSDHYALAAAYFGWRSRCSYGDGDSFVEEHGLSRETLEMGDQLVRSLLRMMVDEYDYNGDDAAFADDADSGSWTAESVFEDPQTWLFCKAALCAAFVPQFVRCSGSGGHFESDTNEEVVGHSSSINSAYRPVSNPYAPAGEKASDDWLVFSDSMKLGKVSIMESSVVGARGILLFSRSLSLLSGGAAQVRVGFDGWQATLVGGRPALRDLQNARNDLHQSLNSALESQTASVLGRHVIDRLGRLLGDRTTALRDICGTREQRIGLKEASTIFVGSLPEQVDEEELRQLFGSCGEVDEVNLVNDRETGRRRGFGFVTMCTREEATLASERLQGAQFKGRRLRLELKAAGTGKGKGKGVTVAVAPPVQRRQWIQPPTEEERLAVVETMRLRAQVSQSRAAEKRKAINEVKVKVEVKVEVGDQSCTQDQVPAKITVTQPAVSLPEEGSIQQWSQLLFELAQVRLGKREAARREEFAEASRLKRRETELHAQLEKSQSSASTGGGAAEVARLQEAKRRAVAEEDFAEASRLKKRLKALEEGGGTGEDAQAKAMEGAVQLAQESGGASELLEELKAVVQSRAAAAKAATGEPALANSCQPAVCKSESGAVEDAARLERSDPCNDAAEESAAKRRRVDSVQVKEEVKKEELEEEQEEGGQASVVPGRTVSQLLQMSNQDLWQHAWNVTWQKADAEGQSGDESLVYAKAQKVWKGWVAERVRLQKDQAAGIGRGKAQELQKKTAGVETLKVAGEEEVERPEEAEADNKLETEVKPVQQAQKDPSLSLSKDQLAAQEEEWSRSAAAQADWEKVSAEVERRRKAKEEAPKTSRDLCALVKQRCPADQPQQFERLLAVCPTGTTVRQLIVAISKEPQEFRQNWDGSEYCVRPVNSRCVDWLPVQATTTPPGFREDASLPEEMLAAAKSIFEERLKPQGQATEDALAQFLTTTSKLPPDTPMPFEELLKHCPPGTQPGDLVRTMSKRRDAFRQDPTGRLFCVKPRGRCGKWAAVNPYLNPLGTATATARAARPTAAAEPPGDGGDY